MIISETYYCASVLPAAFSSASEASLPAGAASEAAAVSAFPAAVTFPTVQKNHPQQSLLVSF